jgi:hypothetical protein
MVRLLNIFVLILISSVCFGQDMSKTQTAKQITVKQDTINKKVVSNTVFKWEPDTVYYKDMEKKMKYLDSINKKRSKQKK